MQLTNYIHNLVTVSSIVIDRGTCSLKTVPIWTNQFTVPNPQPPSSTSKFSLYCEICQLLVFLDLPSISSIRLYLIFLKRSQLFFVQRSRYSDNLAHGLYFTPFHDPCSSCVYTPSFLDSLSHSQSFKLIKMNTYLSASVTTTVTRNFTSVQGVKYLYLTTFRGILHSFLYFSLRHEVKWFEPRLSTFRSREKKVMYNSYKNT